MEKDPQKEAAFVDAVKLMYDSISGYLHELILRGELKMPSFGEVLRFFNKKLAEAKAIAEELQDFEKHKITGMAHQHILKVIDAKNHWKRVLPYPDKREKVRKKLQALSDEIRESLKQRLEDN